MIFDKMKYRWSWNWTVAEVSSFPSVCYRVAILRIYGEAQCASMAKESKQFLVDTNVISSVPFPDNLAVPRKV